jgi:hypothetical protein
VNGRGTRTGTVARAKIRDEDAEPATPPKPSCNAPRATPPNGRIGRIFGIGRSFAAFDFGGGAALARLAAARAAPLSMAARTSGLGTMA